MSATPTGVENHRRSLIGDIVKNRNTAVAGELEEAGGDPEDIKALKGETPVVDTSGDDPKRPADVPADEWEKMSDEDKAAAQKAAEAPPVEEKVEEPAPVVEAEVPAEQKKFKGKVDGKEVEFDEQAVIDAGMRTLQKESTADKRLEEASKARDEAERLRQRVEATLAQPAAQKKSDQETMQAKEDLRPIVKKIQYGSEDEAAEALLEYGSKMAKMGQPNSLTQSELQNILDLREAQSFVKTNYADVMGDDNLKELFVSKVNRKIAAGDGRPYQEICKDIGDELRTWKAPAKTEPTPQAGGSRAQAVERKQKVLNIPAASARQQAATPQKEPTTSDVVAAMRKARGQ